MNLILVLQQIETELKEMHFPIAKEINFTISSEEERETALQKLCAFWHTVSLPVCHPGYISYENEILKLQVRTQNATSVRFLHQIAKSKKLLLDTKINFQYQIPPLDYDYEILMFHRYIGTITPFNFIDYVATLPTGIYAHHCYSEKDIQKERNGYANYNDSQEWDKLSILTWRQMERTNLYEF